MSEASSAETGAAQRLPFRLVRPTYFASSRRAIDLHEGDKIDGNALKALIRAAVALNKSKAKR